MAKNTAEMENEILQADNIYDVISANKDSFCTGNISGYIKDILNKKGIKASKAVRGSGLDRCYGHQIISGTKIPSRDKLIALSFGMGLSLDETNELLKISCNRPLYARDERDAVIIFALANGKNIDNANELLYDKGYKIID